MYVIRRLKFNEHVVQKAVATQAVANPVTLPPVYIT